ncbi:VLRF1 family aeRF1-type release factor [Bacillus nakamurai]|uniref:VLRF1 family aeRF1-type release factor n=1 Tax=Bacillus nakamurai TaxID=1793963 RepID=UPI0020C4244F|nr:VLRF1 family aeRF1-type release factor [Bacillus nakamurai]MCP6682629.1 VLRF1 family aeRF1-type release factor [Bacillus nakamurai]
MAIDSLISKLKYVRLESPDKILSLYVNTDMRNPDQQGGEWKIALKSGFRRLKEYLSASDPEEEKCLSRMMESVYQYIEGLGKEIPRSLVFFASGQSGIWETIELQVPVETRFYWEEMAVLDQLEELREQYPSTAFILTQQNEMKIIETVLGKIEGVEHYEYDVIHETWKPSAISGSTGSMEEDAAKAHIEENQNRLYKRLASNLDQKAAANKWERLVIAGDKETADILDQNMNKPIDMKIQKNLLNENEHKVIEDLLKEA